MSWAIGMVQYWLGRQIYFSGSGYCVVNRTQLPLRLFFVLSGWIGAINRFICTYEY